MGDKRKRNVKKIIQNKNTLSAQELIQKIQNHEQKDFELKSSFKYDVVISNHTGVPTRNNILRKKVVEEIAAFMNTNGGIICLGVDDKKNILGLEKLNFVLFLKKLIIFSNMKIAYQGKREVKNLQSLVLKRI